MLIKGLTATVFVIAAATASMAVECDFDACTVGDFCAEGACVPGEPIDCSSGNLCAVAACSQGMCVAVSKCPPAIHPCRTPVVCNPDTGECETSPANEGQVCDFNTTDCFTGTCQSGECVETVQRMNGTGCSDHNVCTNGDQCSNGVCVGSPVGNGTDCGGTLCAPLVCVAGVCQQAPTQVCEPSMNLCETNLCNPSTGQCETFPITCFTGVCSGEGVCNPSTGQCEYDNPMPEGSSCDDGNICTVNDQCISGACTGTGIDNPSMAPAASPSSLVVLSLLLAVLPALRLARRRDPKA